MKWRHGSLNLALAAAVLLLLGLHAAYGGSLVIPASQFLAELARGPSSGTTEGLVLWQIRLPRTVSAALLGALLAIVGAAFQALFRNPLAEPYVVGVSSGAALGGTLVLLAGGGALLMMAGGFAGGMAALLLVVSLAGLRRGAPVESLLVAGVVIGAMLSSLTSLILIVGGRDANEVLRWLLGSVTPASWLKAAILTGALILCGGGLYLQSRRLDALAMSEEAAARSGVKVGQIRALVLTLGSAATAAAVGAAGVIPFLGLVAPHLVRSLSGESLKKLMPASALAGAALLLGSDLLAQKIKMGAELPVGAVTAIVGAPILLVLLGRQR